MNHHTGTEPFVSVSVVIYRARQGQCGRGAAYRERAGAASSREWQRWGGVQKGRLLEQKMGGGSSARRSLALQDWPNQRVHLR